jgi:hypothetical protein
MVETAQRRNQDQQHDECYGDQQTPNCFALRHCLRIEKRLNPNHIADGVTYKWVAADKYWLQPISGLPVS